jgi:beta-lactamase regulating signal transducer with metallopeptidase domain
MDLLTFLSTATWTHLVAALLHTLWIGLLCAVAAAVALRSQPADRPRLRQSACIAGLLATLLGGCIAWSILEQGSATAPRSAPSAVAARPVAENEPFTPSLPPGLSRPIQTVEPAATHPAIHASTWIAFGWLLGVAAMLTRMLRAVAGAGRLRQNGTPPPANHPLNRLLSELQSRLGSTPKAVILLVDTLKGPAVVGALRPVILWPVAWATGLPEWQVRAMLAHELAHIVRRDYLVNLLQMVVEALLFFNPAVWWMSRQLRIEREACCDALAVRLLGESGACDIARALADVSVGTPTGVLAFGSDQHGSLLGRVRRLLDPGHRPNLRLPWPTLLGLLALIAISLAAIKATGDTVAAKLMSHEERIATMALLKEQTPDYENADQRQYTEQDRITVKGTIRMADGGKLPPNLCMIASISRPQWGCLTDCGLEGMEMNADETRMTFAVPIEFGAIHLSLSAEGCAPQFAGPLKAEPGGTLEGIEFVLDSGFRSGVLLRDGKGQPIPDAEIQIQSEDPTMGWRFTATTGKDGVAVIEHAPSVSVKLEVRHPGYMEALAKQVVLSEGKPYAWTLQKASPTTGLVVDAEQENPLGGVEFRLQQRRSPKIGDMRWHYSNAPLLGTSDTQGRYSIDTLDDSSTYNVVAQTPDRSHAGMFTLLPGETGITVKLQPTLSVSGVIANADRLSRNRDGRIELKWEESILQGQYELYLYGEVDVMEEGTNTAFVLRGALPGRIRIRGKGLREELALKESTADIVLNDDRAGPSPADLQAKVDAEHPLRTIRIRLQAPQGAPIPSGSILAGYSRYEARPETKEGFTQMGETISLPIDENGTATFEIPAPNWLELKPQGLNGYWFPARWTEIETHDAPHETTLTVLPAGAIEGRIFDQLGQPAKGLLISVYASELPTMDFYNRRVIDIKNSASEGDDSSRFLAAPLPLDGTYRIVASTGKSYAFSKPVRLTAEQPFAQVEINMPETADLIGFVTGPDDKPVKGVSVDLSLSLPGYGYGIGNKPLTGVDGRFIIAGLNPSLPEGATYILRLTPASNYAPVSIKFNSIKESLRIRLERGRTVSGTVVEPSSW